MKIEYSRNRKTFDPDEHFGGVKIANVVPFEDSDYHIQLCYVPPGGGAEMHYHDNCDQVFYLMKGELTFNTGKERFTLKQGDRVTIEPQENHSTLNEGNTENVSMIITLKV